MINIFGNGSTVCLDVDSTELLPIRTVNTGGVIVTDTQLLVNIPTGLAYLSHTASVGTYDNGTGIWTIPSLGVGSPIATLNICFTVTDDTTAPWVIEYSAVHDIDPDSIPEDQTAERNIDGFACSEFENCWALYEGQGTSFSNRSLNLGDDTAGTTEPGIFTSDRFINQDGFNLNFIGVDDDIETRISILSDGSIEFDKVDEQTGSSKIYLRVNPLQQSEGNVPWLHSIITAANYGDRWNDVHVMGWNLKGGNVNEAGKHGFGWVTEGFYQEDVSFLRFEDHTIYYGTDGIQRRPESLIITEGNDDWYKYFTVGDLFILDPRTNDKFIQFRTDANASYSVFNMWSPNSDNTLGVEFIWSTTNNRLAISPVGTANSIFDVNGFPYFRSGLIQTTKDAVADNGLTLNALAGNTSDGYFGRIALTSADLVLASSTLSLATVAGVAGTYLSPTSITVDSKGRITAIS